MLDSRPKGRGFQPHRRHCVVSLSKNINPSLVLVEPRKTRPFITERLLMGRKESNQTNKLSGPMIYEQAHEIVALVQFSSNIDSGKSAHMKEQFDHGCHCLLFSQTLFV